MCPRLDLELGEPLAESFRPHNRELDEIGLVELSSPGLANVWARHPPGSIAPTAAATVALLEGEVE